MTEREFQQTVVDMARLLGWKVYHTHDSRRSEPGFPDLCLVRDRIVWLELKTESGRVSPEQASWIAALNAAGGTALVVRPSDLSRVEAALKKRTERKAA